MQIPVPGLEPLERPQWSHHGFEDDEPYVPPQPIVPLVLAPRRLGTGREQFMQGLEMIGGLQSREVVEARLKQQPYDQRDSLLLRSDDDLFVGDDNWREEQDRRYAAASQKAWDGMKPSDIAREGYMKREHSHSHGEKKKTPGRSAQRKAAAEQKRNNNKKKTEGLYPSPTPDDLKALQNRDKYLADDKILRDKDAEKAMRNK
jgi:hypothetical protein